MIKCPATGNAVQTRMRMDRVSFESSKLTDNVIDGCPECGGRHTWSKEDAFLEE